MIFQGSRSGGGTMQTDEDMCLQGKGMGRNEEGNT